MSEADRARPAHGQDDSAGRSRPGSPTRVPGSTPPDNYQPSARPHRTSSEDDAVQEPQTGVLRDEEGREPNVPPPMIQEGAPD